MELNRDNYFSSEAESLYLGSSSFKAWDILDGGCEARELAVRNGEYEKPSNDAFLLGSYVHAWCEGRLQEFIVDTPELFYKNGSGKLLAKYALGDDMINVLRNDTLFNQIRDSSEKEQIFTGKIGGYDFKIQVDMLNIKQGFFCDLKTTKDLSETYWDKREGRRVSFIKLYRYKRQLAIYAEILRQNLGMAEGEYLNPAIAVVDKKKSPDHEIIFMGTDFIEEELEYIKSRLDRIMRVRLGKDEPMSCGECAYCLSKKDLKQAISYSDYLEKLGLEE